MSDQDQDRVEFVADERNPTAPTEDETAPADSTQGNETKTTSSDDTPRYRGASNDPLFGLLIALAVSVGLMPLANADPDLRYTLTWGLLIAFGVLAWLIGNFPRIIEERPEDLAWGIALGLILAIPLLAFGSGVLADLSERIFEGLGIGVVLAYLVFIMPMGESMFFRGILQDLRPFWEVAIIATFWGLILFFPAVNAGPLPVILAIILAMINALYGYVRLRNGLAAAWLAQITVNLVIFFFPLL